MQTVHRSSSLHHIFPITGSFKPAALSPWALLLAASLLLTACGSDTDSDGGAANAADTAASSSDAVNTGDDSGAADATVGDGASSDAAGADAAIQDAGTPDAGTPDAGTPDAGPAPTAKYVARTQTQVKALLAKQPRPLLINVHIPFGGEIVGTDKHAAYNNVAGLEAALGNDKSAFAVLYCMTGPMSYSAVNALVKLGYWNLIDMPGGFVKWKSLGYPFSKTKASK